MFKWMPMLICQCVVYVSQAEPMVLPRQSMQWPVSWLHESAFELHSHFLHSGKFHVFFWHALQSRPTMPSRQSHWPVSRSHKSFFDPLPLQLHSSQDNINNNKNKKRRVFIWFVPTTSCSLITFASMKAEFEGARRALAALFANHIHLALTLSAVRIAHVARRAGAVAFKQRRRRRNTYNWKLTFNTRTHTHTQRGQHNDTYNGIRQHRRCVCRYCKWTWHTLPWVSCFCARRVEPACSRAPRILSRARRPACRRSILAQANIPYSARTESEQIKLNNIPTYFSCCYC